MKPSHSRAEDDLNAFLDAALAGRTGRPVAIDPTLALTVGHVHGLPGPSPDPLLKRQVWSTLIAKSAPAPALSLMPSHAIAATRPEAEFTPAALPRHRRRFDRGHADRRDWGSFATAAFLLIFVATISGGVFMLGRPHTDGSAPLPAGLAATSSPGSLYIGHFARLTAKIPDGWTVDPSGLFDYAGPDGFVLSQPVASQAVDDACAAMAGSMDAEFPPAVSATVWSGRDACRIDGSLRGVEVAAIVVPHTMPFSIETETYAFAALIADPNHVDEIAATIDFSPERVTPEAYAISLLDLVETRSLWSHQIHWPTVRGQVLDYIDGLETVEMARQGIFNLINQNLRLTDDYRTTAEAPNRQTEREGFGALVAGDQVVLVYPGSPAEQAGIQPGDRIEAIGGYPVVASTLLLDASMLVPIGGRPFDPFTTTLTLLRPGTAAPIDVSVTSGPLDQSPRPAATRIAGDIGLLTLPGGTLAAHEDDYVATAHEAIAQLDAAPACGWIVDLRLASTRSYPPILASVGPFLGDGVIAGWRGREGGQSWVAYEDGVVTEDGYAIAAYTGVQAPELRQPEAPVAILIGPYTARGGEVAALGFAGQPNTRLFGERTRGDTALTRTYPLFDGSSLSLAEAMLTDRSGGEYPDGIQPDEEIPTIWAAYGTDADPAIVAARDWLAQQPCT